jgi:hypothetical protein
MQAQTHHVYALRAKRRDEVILRRHQVRAPIVEPLTVGVAGVVDEETLRASGAQSLDHP